MQQLLLEQEAVLPCQFPGCSQVSISGVILWQKRVASKASGLFKYSGFFHHIRPQNVKHKTTERQSSDVKLNVESIIL